MGNCNSSSAISQRCTGCGHATCDCTQGLGSSSQCSSCPEHYKYNVPGTYDAQYNQWLKDNPKPVEPRFDPMPDIVAGDFICQQCTQCQEFSNLSGKSVTITDPSQAMSCIGKIEAAINSQTASEAAEKAAADTAAWQAARQASGMQPATSDPQSGSNIWLYILLIMLVVLMAAVAGYFMLADDEPAAQVPAAQVPAAQAQMQQYQQPMQQYAPMPQYQPMPQPVQQYQQQMPLQPPSYSQVQNTPQMYPPAPPMQPYVQYPAPQYTNL